MNKEIKEDENVKGPVLRGGVDCKIHLTNGG
jgi:hypothetical protein